MPPKKQLESYKRVKKLGEGAMGVAWLVNCKNAGIKAVMKQVDMEDLDEEGRKEAF